jgi:uncharacterized protein YcbK (DUF882 family)
LIFAILHHRFFKQISFTRFAAAALVCACLFISNPLQSAKANGDTRSLMMYHNHTGESINIVYKRDGRYDRDALKKLNWFLRDWRKGEATEMDPRLLDLVWEASRNLGAKAPIHIICGYRSEGTNNMLRARSSGVAQHSQHTLGKAMDIAIPGVPPERLREAGMLLQKGGVGFYPTSGTPFVHLDVGNVRAWPRMTTQQLVRLFPSGETLHLPSDGPPLAGYYLALARLGRDGKNGDEPLLAFADEQKPSASRNILAAWTSEPKTIDDSNNALTVAALRSSPAQQVRAEVAKPVAIPIPTARPLGLVQMASLSSTGPAKAKDYSAKPAKAIIKNLAMPSVGLTALHYEASAVSGFFTTAITEHSNALTAPQMTFSVAYLQEPESVTKSFTPRKWVKLALNGR